MVFEKYLTWQQNAVDDKDLVNELKSMEDGDIIDAFYKHLEFGTAGLRGVIGAGTNRMNIYTVGKATQGLAAYINSISKNGKVAIAYDSRIKSDVFAKHTASILAANGIKVYIYKELAPVPMLSFAVRYLKCDAGVVITASHNPAKYNGYKAYGADGSQLSPEASDYVLDIMNKVDIFKDVKTMDFPLGVSQGIIEYIGDDVVNAYLGEVEKCRINPQLDLSNLNVIYSPLHGSGNKPVREILKRIGVTNVTVVTEQEEPDGNFPTAPYPNPEIKEAFNCALELAKTVKPDLLFATDPDCDRVGIAVPCGNDYRLFTGNEVGVMLLEYILKCKKANGTLPKNPVGVKTIVTTEICKKIAADYGCEMRDVLTGFKFIGEQIALLEKDGQADRYVLGFEESYGYLSRGYVRDKDGVNASMLICEMTAYYKSIGKDLITVLDDIYKKYGYCLCVQKSFACEGQSGMARIAEIMTNLRKQTPKEICGIDVVEFKDYKKSIGTNLETGEETVINLPKANVLSFGLKDGSSVIVRPSGTEPKIKIYVNAIGATEVEADKKRSDLLQSGSKLLGF
ncbi:MAG: phospho-sugar mutase [Ruminococcaceae bacterium]|nr:phospho-sugar mutase [Oscillospiraceae bacterium]